MVVVGFVVLPPGAVLVGEVVVVVPVLVAVPVEVPVIPLRMSHRRWSSVGDIYLRQHATENKHEKKRRDFPFTHVVNPGPTAPS